MFISGTAAAIQTDVEITGGTISGLSVDLAVNDGGTGASTPSGARSNLGAAASGDVTASGLTMSTSRLLGRTSGSTGAVEEITMGSNVSLSGGTLSFSAAGNVTNDQFSGNGSTTVFTLSGAPPSITLVNVFIDGVYQAQSTYTLVGATLTFLVAPPTGTNNIQVKWSDGAIAVNVPADGSVSTVKLGGDITSAGKALLDDADAAAQRATLGVTIGSQVQAWDADLDAIAAISGTSGILTKTGAGTWALDTNTYLTTGAAASNYQPLDGDLTAIGALSGTSGLLKKTAANTWALDTTSYTPLDGTGATGYWNISVNAAAVANYINNNQSNWVSYLAGGTVAGLLGWKNYGNSHVIFDASNSTTPSGTACNNTTPDNGWTGTYPTLMGWNGSNTFGVRVDMCRYADSAGTASSASYATSAGSAAAIPTGTGAVYTYAFLARAVAPGANSNAGTTAAGSNLRYSNAGGTLSSNAPAGTWVQYGFTGTSLATGPTVWLRLS